MNRFTTAITTITDPVCGMSISKAHAAGSSEYGGTTYYFCNPSCKAKFDTDPAAYTVQDHDLHDRKRR